MPVGWAKEFKQKVFCYMCRNFKKHSHSKGFCGLRNKYVYRYKEACNNNKK
jgi:hypothetical protein